MNIPSIPKYILNILSSLLFISTSLFSNAQHETFMGRINSEDTNDCTTVSTYIDASLLQKELLEAAVPQNQNTIHVFTHGKPGSLLIDGEWLDAIAIKNWFQKRYVTQDYLQLNIYGCNFAQGEKGKKAVTYLQNELGISVAASTNVTGKGGDWKLEIGDIDIQIESYAYNLQCTGAPGEDCDNDGVLNEDDIDDDNDGILDVVENVCEGSIGTTGQLNYAFFDEAPTDFTVDNIPVDDLATQSGVVSNFNVDALRSLITPGDDNTYSIRYSGFIEIDVAGTYTFYTSSDDGSKLFIDGVEVVDNDGLHADNEEQGDITLATGVHPIEILFFENTGLNVLTVSYESSTISKQAIPFSILGDGVSVFCDTDNDGIVNSLDLDSDNDGIPDNVEAQSTLAYQPPLGTDGDNDGLDDRYDSTPSGNANGSGSIGINLQDTDNDEVDDFLDLDSDNDSIFDIDEAGLEATDSDNDGRTNGTVGANGLDNANEVGDTDQAYTDVNGDVNDPENDLTDTDGDVNSGGDLNYRDTDEVIAVDDTAIIAEGTGSNNLINVLSNDLEDGVTATALTVDITQINTTNSGVSIDLITGNVEVLASVPIGTYTINYQICSAGATTNCDTAAVTVAVLIDTDGDTIPDATDIDDDNDGILDVSEDECAASLGNSGRLNYSFFDIAPTNNTVDNIPDNSLATQSGVVSNFDVSALESSITPGDGEDYSIRYTGRIAINSADNYTFYTSSDDGSKLFIDGIEVVDNDGLHPNTEEQGQINLAVGVYTIEVLFFERTGGDVLSVRYESSTIAKQLVPFTILGDGVITNCDTDNDGINNSLDLDSDNDGIPDNVEAQSTIAYQFPLGVDSDNDGLDDRYDADDSNIDPIISAGIDPVNTDNSNDLAPDYLDLDSDNDDVFDIVEAGLGAADTDDDGRANGTVGANGLDNANESSDTDQGYTDVNGDVNDPLNDLTDTDGDANSGGDVDYRDALTFMISMPTQIVLENNAFTSVAPSLVDTPTGVITYTLSGVDANRFTIDSSTGIVSMVPRDFENPEDDNVNNFYNLTITATSNTGGSAANDFTVIVNNECEVVDIVQNTLRATDPVGDAAGDTATLQVEVSDATGTPRSGVTVTITKESGPGTIAAATGVTNASGIYTTTVSSTTAGIATYSAQYAATTGAADTDVELGNPTLVRFLDDVNNLAVTGEVGIATNAPDPSSVLEVVGTDKGLLVPNVALRSSSDTVTIPRPAVSLMVYNTNDTASLASGFVFFDGTQWVSLCQERVVIQQ